MAPLERAVFVRMHVSELRQVVHEELPESLGESVTIDEQLAQLDHRAIIDATFLNEGAPSACARPDGVTGASLVDLAGVAVGIGPAVEPQFTGGAGYERR